MGTGAIWTRWCLIIKPRNVLYVESLASPVPPDPPMTQSLTYHRLAAVNFFLGCVGVVQVSRIYMWRKSQEGSATEAAKDMEQDVADSAKAIATQAKGAVKSAEKSVEKST